MNLNIAHHRMTVNPFAQFLAGVMIIASLTLVSAVPAHAVDPIGTASGTRITCPAGGASGGICDRVTISGCAGGTFYAGVKINTPPQGETAIGAVILTTGAGGNTWYDNDPSFMRSGECSGNCGMQTVLDLNNAKYYTIQTNFSDPSNPGGTGALDGWLTGSTTSQIGARELACRYATMANWIWTSVLGGGENRPVCATGNSAGSAAIAYAISQYGLGTWSPGPAFRTVELTSGPPLSRLDYGCLSTSAAPTYNAECFSKPVSLSVGLGNDENIIDPSYDGEVDNCNSTTCLGAYDYCANSYFSGSASGTPLLHDSILSDSDPPTLSYPNTTVRSLFGSLDTAGPPAQGQEYYDQVTTTKSEACVQNVGHPMPGYLKGEQQIVADLENNCK
jgi:hypothetical protein